MERLNVNSETGYWTEVGYWEHEEITTLGGGSFFVNTTFVATGRLMRVHPPHNCAGRGCGIHGHPSDHPLKDAPLYWDERASNGQGQLYRKCEHGIYHADHDSEVYLKSIGVTIKHICDGCCVVIDVPTTASWIDDLKALEYRRPRRNHTD